jgi:hypothetical protein
MAVSIQIYSNSNATTKTVSIDFAADVLAASFGTSTGSDVQYFFKLSTGARDEANVALPVKVVKSLNELALNPTNALQKQSATNTNVAYTSIKSMIVDYVYDYVEGHTADQFTSGCTLQRPMKFN